MSDRAAASIVLNGGDPLLPKQEELFRSRALVNAVLGGWGSGKSRSAALALLANCIRNPYTPAYGDDRPFSIIVAPTHKVLKDSIYREFRAVCPRELILREWRSPDWEILLANGHVVKMRTVRGTLEGASAVGLLVSEIHMVPDEKIWLNYQARARDPRAKSRMVIAEGLPESGWLQSCFGRHQSDQNRLTLFMSSRENTYLPAEVIEQFKRSAPGKAAEKYIDGKWMTPEDRVYYQFEPSKHYVSRRGDKRSPVLVGVDVGDQSAAVFVQRSKARCVGEGGRPFTANALHVVDELHLDHLSTEAVCRQIRDRGWLINAESAIFVDPTMRRDEIDGLRKVFPAITLIRKSRRGGHDATEPGHHAINAALGDADGNVRLTFDHDLPRDRGCLYPALLQFKRTPRGIIHRDNVADHVLDALRYVVAHELPAGRSGHEIRSRW